MGKLKIKVTFIVNGIDVPIAVDLFGPVKLARDEVLDLSNNTGRLVDEWDVHSAAGEVVQPLKSFLSQGIEEDARIFLNLKVGAGGAFSITPFREVSVQP